MYYLTMHGNPARLAQKLEPMLHHAKTEMVHEVALNAGRYAKLNAKRGQPGLIRRSGNLEGAIYARGFPRSSFADGFEINVGADLNEAPYARIHELGGVIRPRKAGGYLQFKVRDGNWVKVRAVNMPARPYLEPARDTALKDIAPGFTAELGA